MSSQCQSGECNRKAFEMPSGCPPVEKPPIIDVQACELPPLVPTEFERHPLVVDLPSIPINVGCACIDVETHMTVSDDRHTKNKIKFHQADGATDCCAGLYALDLQLNIPTCSTDPPNITGQGSRGITVSGKGIPRADEPCMFDLDMDITVPCPLEGITIGDGKGIAKIEKGPPPSFADCSLSFDVNVPCPLPGITFTVTGQASGSIVTGGRSTSIAADGNNSTVDSGGNGGGRIGGNTVLSFGRPRIFAASGGGASGGGASGASGGGGGGGGEPCALELKLNVPCQLPNVSATKLETSQRAKIKPGTGRSTIIELNEAFKVFASKKHEGIIAMSESSDSESESNDCTRDIQVAVPDIELPCQISSGLDVGATVKPRYPVTTVPSIDLSKAIKLVKDDETSNDDCKVTLRLEADNLPVPCEKLDLDLEGQISGNVADSSDDCDKVLSLSVPCQLDILKVDITGQASGDIHTDTTSSNDCAKQLTVDVPCQLDIIEVKDTIKPSTGPGSEGHPIVPANNNGVISLSDAVKLTREPASGQHRSDSCDMSLQIVASDISVPCENLTTNPTGEVTASFTKDTSTGANPCDKVLNIDVPCQLPNIKVLETIKPYSPTTQNPKISLKDAIRLLKATGASGECEASLQLEADDVTIPCEGLSLDITGPASGVVRDSSNDCDKTLSITVDCQLDNLALDVTGEATGEIVNDTSTLKACAKKITLDVPCQLEKLKFKTDYGEETPVPAPTGGVIDPGNIVWYSTGAAGSCDESSDGVTLHLRKFKVPVVKVDKASGSRITIEPVVEDNITTYKLGGGGVEYSGWTENNSGRGTIGIAIGSDNKIKPTGGNGDVHLVNDLKIKDNYIKRVMVHLYFRHGLYQGISATGEYNSSISVANC